MPSFIVTLGAMVVYRGIVLYFTPRACIYRERILSRRLFRPHGRNSEFRADRFVLIGVAAFMLNLTVFGREVRAIGGGERIAHLSGIQVHRVKILIFVLSGLLCGMAGLLQGARPRLRPPTRRGTRLVAIAAVVVGGTPLPEGREIEGTILGALIITILSNGMNIIELDPYFQNIVKGLVLVLSVFVTIDREKIGIIK